MNNACNKARFNNWAEANERLKDIQSRKQEYKKYKIPSRVYKCPLCNGFHLTSKEKRDNLVPLENYHPKWLQLIK